MVDIRRKLPLFQANDVNISKDVNLVWSIANTLRGAYRADKYRDVIIPMFVLACPFTNQGKSVGSVPVKSVNARENL